MHLSSLGFVMRCFLLVTQFKLSLGHARFEGFMLVLLKLCAFCLVTCVTRYLTDSS